MRRSARITLKASQEEARSDSGVARIAWLVLLPSWIAVGLTLSLYGIAAHIHG